MAIAYNLFLKSKIFKSKKKRKEVIAMCEGINGKKNTMMQKENKASVEFLGEAEIKKG